MSLKRAGVVRKYASTNSFSALFGFVDAVAPLDAGLGAARAATLPLVIPSG